MPNAKKLDSAGLDDSVHNNVYRQCWNNELASALLLASFATRRKPAQLLRRIVDDLAYPVGDCDASLLLKVQRNSL